MVHSFKIFLICHAQNHWFLLTIHLDLSCTDHFTGVRVQYKTGSFLCSFAAACKAPLFAMPEAHVTVTPFACFSEIHLLKCTQFTPAVLLVTAAGHDLVPFRAIDFHRVAHTRLSCHTCDTGARSHIRGVVTPSESHVARPTIAAAVMWVRALEVGSLVPVAVVVDKPTTSHCVPSRSSHRRDSALPSTLAVGSALHSFLVAEPAAAEILGLSHSLVFRHDTDFALESIAFRESLHKSVFSVERAPRPTCADSTSHHCPSTSIL